ncbi:hypothetical protein [Bermanella sp. R86510]|uniref:hypothetical protein n=1 Tax=unclassified Bermanella TaxID=2627862 RepID=UPI0037C97E2C
MKKTLLTLASASLLSMSAQAEQLWSDNSVSVLYGSNYIEPFAFDSETEVTYTTLTLEHVSGHSWGGLFYFVDRHSGEGFTDTYIEFSPTFNLASFDGAITGLKAAYTLESGAGHSTPDPLKDNGDGFENHMVGLGVDLAIPGMDYANATLFRAFNDKLDINKGDDNMLQLVYGYSHGQLTIDGFLDYRFGNDDGTNFGDVEDSLNFTPQITYNLGPALGFKNKFKLGVEYSYWTNKFGIDGADQNAVSLLLKAHL